MSAVEQLELWSDPACTDAATLAEWLGQGAPDKVALRLTRNRVSMAWIDFARRGMIRVSLDEQFLSAPAPVLSALKRFIRQRRRKDWDRVSRFAQGLEPLADKAGRRSHLRTRGRVHDLRVLARDVNHRFFEGRIRCRVGWGRDGKPGRGKRCSIRFGSWNETARTIRVHPRLDDESVPQDFVRYIIYHEMLHSVVPAECSGGRRYTHTSAFRTLERKFPGYERMQSLSRELLDRLETG